MFFFSILQRILKVKLETKKNLHKILEAVLSVHKFIAICTAAA